MADVRVVCYKRSLGLVSLSPHQEKIFFMNTNKLSPQPRSSWVGIIVSAAFLISLATAIDAAIIAHYQLDGNLNDSSGNGLDGQYTGPSPVIFTSDVSPFSTVSEGQALDARADFDFVEVPDHELLHITGDLTLEAVIRPFNELPGGGVEPHTIVAKQNSGGTGTFLTAYALQYNQDSGEFGALISYGIGSGRSLTSIGKFADTNWHHVAMTLKRGEAQATFSLYVDGKLEASEFVPSEPLFFGERPLYIGAGNFATANGTGEFRRNFIGFIDEVRISDEALSPSQFLDAPKLQIRWDGVQATISWEREGYHLESAQQLSGTWQPLASRGSPFHFVPHESQMFYRLRSD